MTAADWRAEYGAQITYKWTPWGAAEHLRVWRLDGGDGIPWDVLQAVKNELLGADAWAVELYPAAGSVVDEVNMRHLFHVPEEMVWPLSLHRGDDRGARLGGPVIDAPAVPERQDGVGAGDGLPMAAEGAAVPRDIRRTRWDGGEDPPGVKAAREAVLAAHPQARCEETQTNKMDQRYFITDGTRYKGKWLTHYHKTEDAAWLRAAKNLKAAGPKGKPLIDLL